MKEKVLFPVNPDILKWLLTEYNLDPETFAKKVQTSYARVEKWLSGEETPTYKQAIKIAELFKRNEFSLALNECESTNLTAQFRLLPKEHRNEISFLTRLAIDEANRKIESLHEMLGFNKAFRQFVTAISPPSEVPSRSAVQVRERLNISFDLQKRFQNSDAAFRIYRAKLEEVGVFTFLEDLANTRAFCISDDDFPVIFINSKDTSNARIFSLFHELGHILNRETDIILGDYMLNNLTNEEILCNRFASEVLVGETDFAQVAKSISVWDKTIINTIAAKFKVSTTVIARRLLDHSLISKELYNQVAHEAVQFASAPKSQKDEKDSTGGPSFYKIRLSRLGKKYTEIVLRQHYSGRISERDVVSYLNMKYKNLPGLEAALYR